MLTREALTEDPNPTATQAPADRPAKAYTGPWLYVSKRLDALWLPDEPPFRVPALWYGAPGHEAAYYRVTGPVVAWLEAAGESLAARAAAGQADRGQVEAFVAAMGPVWEFARAAVDDAELGAARRAGGRLPELAPAQPCDPNPGGRRCV